MPRGKMTDDHKRAIKKGRKEASIVKAYLDQVSSAQRRVADPKTIERRLKAVETKIANEANRLRLLDLVQQRINLEKALAAASQTGESADSESEFIGVAKTYAARKGIDYNAFRALGVSASTLKKAGISRAAR